MPCQTRGVVEYPLWTFELQVTSADGSEVYYEELELQFTNLIPDVVWRPGGVPTIGLAPHPYWRRAPLDEWQLQMLQNIDEDADLSIEMGEQWFPVEIRDNHIYVHLGGML